MTDKLDHISQPLSVETEDNSHLNLEKESYYEEDKSNYSAVNTNDSIDSLGPLPAKWEKAYTESGEVYFIE